jgi:hypothetical protein
MQNQILGETLISLVDAAGDFGGIEVPISTLRRWVYQGYRGLKLETVSINGRYTSREAIQRFIERKQSIGCPPEPKVKSLTQAQIDAGLRKHGIIK